MNLRRSLLLGSAVAALVVGSALPASAGPTTTTFALTGGALTLSTPATATLTDAPTGTAAISGSLGANSVSDLRGGTAGWIVTAASTAFTGPGPTTSTAIGYTGGTVTETGTITVADGALVALTTSAASVVTATAISGNNTAAWDPSSR